MGYATKADLISRYGAEEIEQLSDRTREGSTDEEVVEAALRRADAEIDGRLAAAYPVPLTEVAPIVVEFACQIARYRLHVHAAPERVRKDYEDAIAYLDRVAQGKAKLGVDRQGDAQVRAPTVHAAPAADRVFSLGGGALRAYGP